jgi:hypothetical protein
MTRDEILKVLDESDLRDEDGFRVLLLPKMYLNDVISFAELIAAHEREACAMVVEINAMACNEGILKKVLNANADAIRARGQE